VESQELRRNLLVTSGTRASHTINRGSDTDTVTAHTHTGYTPDTNGSYGAIVLYFANNEQNMCEKRNVRHLAGPRGGFRFPAVNYNTDPNRGR